MQSINYDRVCLLPRYSEIKSRDDVSTDVEFLGRTFKSPAMPANMACCIDFKLAEQLSEAGYFYILHRFYPYEEILKWITSSNLQTISISVGVKEIDKQFIHQFWLNELQADFITIDVAHGHHILVKEMIEYIKSRFHGRFQPKIIAGNVMSYDACIDLLNWGADGIKVGLSQGKGCSTYNATGVGCGMWSSVFNANETDNSIPIIADGGIREIGDISKALVAGAHMVMIGSEFARLYESPAPFDEFDQNLKVYYGSASEINKGHDKYVEGFQQSLPVKYLTYEQYLDKISQGIRSTMSYAGITDIRKLPEMGYVLK